MTEQEKREKVIKGLECCLPMMSPHGLGHCNKCPYNRRITIDDGITGCCWELIYDALELLKAQEPRVMTFDEVKKHYNLPPVFTDDLEMQEDYYQDIQPLYFEFPNPCAWDVHWRSSNQVRTYLEEWEDRYNKTWRCWTSRPTDEQRGAAKWK